MTAANIFMNETEKTSKRKQCILRAVNEALAEVDYSKLSIEDIASRAGVGKSTIYRWWKHKSDLVFETFKENTASVFELEFDKSLQYNLSQQLLKLSMALNQQAGRALLVVMAENREAAGDFFKQYLLPRREQTRKLIQLSIERQEIRADYDFETMLDMLYAAVHYQIIFFNCVPDEAYVEKLVTVSLAPIMMNKAD